MAILLYFPIWAQCGYDQNFYLLDKANLYYKCVQIFYFLDKANLYYKCVLQLFAGDVARVNGQLAVSRAFGDKSLKSHLRSDPDILDMNVDVNCDILILGSDGIWKVNGLS